MGDVKQVRPPGGLDMATAHKDRPILAWVEHAADPYVDPESETGRLTTYAAHHEGLSKAPDGLQVLVWGGAYQDRDEASGTSWKIEDWWFVCGSEWETVANPVCWWPMPWDGDEATGLDAKLFAEREKRWRSNLQDMGRSVAFIREATEAFCAPGSVPAVEHVDGFPEPLAEAKAIVSGITSIAERARAEERGQCRAAVRSVIEAWQHARGRDALEAALDAIRALGPTSDAVASARAAAIEECARWHDDCARACLKGPVPSIFQSLREQHLRFAASLRALAKKEG